MGFALIVMAQVRYGLHVWPCSILLWLLARLGYPGHHGSCNKKDDSVGLCSSPSVLVNSK